MTFVSPVSVLVFIPGRPVVAFAAARRRTAGRCRTGWRAARSRGRRLALLTFLLELGKHVPELVIAKVHLTTEVVSKTTVRVEDGEVGAADVADTELLVTRRAGRVCQLLKFSLHIKSVRKSDEGNRRKMRASFSAFSLFKASIAAISRIDSSTFPCSPRVSIFSVPP